MDLHSLFALGIIVFVFLTFVYGIVAIHDIPYNIAKARNHPHQDAIHAAGMGEPLHPACHLAILVDSGNGLSAGPRLRFCKLSAGQLSPAHVETGAR